METVHLHHVWNYTEFDRTFWREHLEEWVPRRIIDAHVHVVDPSLRRVEPTEEMRRSYWVCEVSEPQDAEGLARCYRTVYPGREVSLVCFGHPSLDYDIEGANRYVSRQCADRGWTGLVVSRPEWSAEELGQFLDMPRIIGVKPYYSMIGRSEVSRDAHIQASIFDFLPHHQLELLNERKAWVTLHVPKRERLGHPDNIREVREIRRWYPDVVLVIAHLGRSYTEPHAREGLPPLADEQGLYFDISAVLNPDVLRLALELIGPSRLLYGTDNPVFYMRGRRQWRGRQYINRTNHPFHFNTEREPPEIEAGYTLYMYEALAALKRGCVELGLTREQVEGILFGNADRLLKRISEARRTSGSDD